MKGPYLRFAVFCRRAELTGRRILNLVEVTDEIVLIPGMTQVACDIAVSVVAEDGDRHIEVVIVGPDGREKYKRAATGSFSTLSLSTLAYDHVLLPAQVGHHWMQVRCDGNLLGESPLEILGAAQ